MTLYDRPMAMVLSGAYIFWPQFLRTLLQFTSSVEKTTNDIQLVIHSMWSWTWRAETPTINFLIFPSVSGREPLKSCLCAVLSRTLNSEWRVCARARERKEPRLRRGGEGASPVEKKKSSLPPRISRLALRSPVRPSASEAFEAAISL